MKSPQQIAQAWFNKAQNEPDDFDRFVYLWFSFNALYNQYFFKYESDAIRDWLNDYYHNLDNQKLRCIINAKPTKYFMNRIIRDCRGDQRDTSEYASRLLNTQNSMKYKLKSLLMILYQVRCNLFHGNKIYDRDSDMEVMKNAADALANILSLVLQNNSR